MGQTLTHPATSKTTESGQNRRVSYAVTGMQGWRIKMEDAHTVVLDLDSSQDDSNMFFAVYDGHGGSGVAQFAGTNVHKRLVAEEAYREKQYDEALKRAFLGTDEDLLADPRRARDPSGCTAVAALVTGDSKIIVANAGDSRSVLSTKGDAKPLSYDHKPSNDGEKARITAAGGYIEYGRVNGNLALSRALGDFEFKKNYSLIPEHQVITADPDIITHEITDEDEFLIIACDGIWDCMSSQQCVDYVRYKISEGKALTEIGEEMCDYCLAPDTSSGAGHGCDNMTIMVVAILHGRTEEEWREWVTDRVKSKYNGHDLSSGIDPLYEQSRLDLFKERLQNHENGNERQARRDDEPSYEDGIGMISAWGPNSRSVLERYGVPFPLGSQIIREMFGADRDEDLEEDDNMEFASDSDDETVRPHESITLSDPGHLLQGEAPLPPPPPEHRHGLTAAPVKQLERVPGGDEPNLVVQMEGLMDRSEDPTMTAA